MGKLSNSMWRLLGAQSTRNQSKSLGVIKDAEAHTDWAAELADDAFGAEAEKLDIAEKPADRAKFLALVREAADRTIDLRPFDVQLQGALRLLEGDIVEMATGEGKTLAGAIAAIGHVLQGHQVHVISVNDYLATRDAEWMKPLFDAFGITVHAVSENSSREERRRAYTGDVTYGSVNEIGFDVLRDQLALSEADLVSPTPDVAIIDEADSVLVDEALVPLVLAEKGCIEYGSAVDLRTPVSSESPREDVVTVIEKWESFEALQNHLAAVHMHQYRQTVKELVVGVELLVLQPA